ncbi:MAG: hypothetical protein Q4B04_00270 [bacterium]|nr:hypothetical protein [bacterium]
MKKGKYVLLGAGIIAGIVALLIIIVTVVAAITSAGSVLSAKKKIEQTAPWADYHIKNGRLNTSEGFEEWLNKYCDKTDYSYSKVVWNESATALNGKASQREVYYTIKYQGAAVAEVTVSDFASYMGYCMSKELPMLHDDDYYKKASGWLDNYIVSMSVNLDFGSGGENYTAAFGIVPDLVTEGYFNLEKSKVEKEKVLECVNRNISKTSNFTGFFNGITIDGEYYLYETNNTKKPQKGGKLLIKFTLPVSEEVYYTPIELSQYVQEKGATVYYDKAAPGYVGLEGAKNWKGSFLRVPPKFDYFGLDVDGFNEEIKKNEQIEHWSKIS